MAYGLSPRAFIAGGPAEQVARAGSNRWRHQSWRALSEARRLALIEQALRPANDRVDGFPAAL